MNLCMDIAYIVSNKQIILPKHFSLGLAAHQLSDRSKKLAQLLSQANHIIDCNKVLEADTALAEETLKTLDEETGAILPPNISVERLFLVGSDIR